jgi:putative transcriptional regulator
VEDSLAGRLLVASHELVDSNFRHAVVLVLAHERQEGAAGVILNRPSTARLPERLDAWQPVIAAPPVLFLGGPVSQDMVICVGLAARAGASDYWQPVACPIVVVDLSSDAALACAELRSIRLFAGHAGWASGQLEREIASGAWFVVTVSTADPVTPQPDELWRTVLARQGGLFTTVPLNPELN